MNPFTTFYSTKNQILKKLCFEKQKWNFKAVVFHCEAGKQEHNNFKTLLKWKKKGFSCRQESVGKQISVYRWIYLSKFWPGLGGRLTNLSLKFCRKSNTSNFRNRFLLEHLRWLPIKWLILSQNETQCQRLGLPSLPYWRFFYPYPQRVYWWTGRRALTSFPNFLSVDGFPFLSAINTCILYYLPGGI